MHRFFAPDLDPSAQEVRLPEDESRHLLRVLRLASGDRVLVFDGRGSQWVGEVADSRERRATVRLLRAQDAARETRIPLTLAMAILKHDRMDLAVRDAVAMGVVALQPLLPARADVPQAAACRPERVERWQRIAVASAKQCGRAVVPLVHAPRSLEAHVRSSSEERLRLIMAEPDLEVVTRHLQELDAPAAAEIMTGPVGGWTRDELDAALGRGVVPVRLGARTLRAETAPVVAIAAAQALWNDL